MSGDHVELVGKSPGRLSNEKTLMNQKFPQFKLGLAEKDHSNGNTTIVRVGQKYWLGWLTTISRVKYNILLAYPIHYPGGEIRAYVLSPKN